MDVEYWWLAEQFFLISYAQTLLNYVAGINIFSKCFASRLSVIPENTNNRIIMANEEKLSVLGPLNGISGVIWRCKSPPELFDRQRFSFLSYTRQPRSRIHRLYPDSCKKGGLPHQAWGGYERPFYPTIQAW